MNMPPQGRAMRVPMPRLLTAVMVFGALGSWLALELKTHARLWVEISPMREEAVRLAQLHPEKRRLVAQGGRLKAVRREHAALSHSLSLKRAEATGQQAP